MITIDSDKRHKRCPSCGKEIPPRYRDRQKFELIDDNGNGAVGFFWGNLCRDCWNEITDFVTADGGEWEEVPDR